LLKEYLWREIQQPSKASSSEIKQAIDILTGGVLALR